MTTIDPKTTVGELVRQHPIRAKLFEELKIDFCCGGKIPLTEVCENKNLNLDQLIAMIRTLDTVSAGQNTQTVDADKLSLSELTDHIVQTHHAYVREELPRLEFMTRKVHAVHGEHDPRLAQVRQAFVELQNEMNSHMLKEEQVLFPMIRRLDTAKGALPGDTFSVSNPIRQMEAEHDAAGAALETINNATDGYQPPEWACNTYRAMLDGLARLERDMHQHVHKENNVLFPKAMQREAELLTA